MYYVGFFSVLLFLNCNLCDCLMGKIIIRKGLTQTEKSEIVDLHNKLRSCIATSNCDGVNHLIDGKITQPAAQNILELIWDDELAEKAQNWADKCEYIHDKPEDRRVGRFRVGQNIAITGSTRKDKGQPDFETAIMLWFNEHVSYNFNKLQQSDCTRTGSQQLCHYTQMVWARVYTIGCGYVAVVEGYWRYKYYVCNYGPAGNYIGRKPYKLGQPTCNESKGLTPSINYNGLCKRKNTGVTADLFDDDSNESEIDSNEGITHTKNTNFNDNLLNILTMTNNDNKKTNNDNNKNLHHLNTKEDVEEYNYYYNLFLKLLQMVNEKVLEGFIKFMKSLQSH